MGTLIFLCPATGDEVSTGLEMDLPALERLELGKVSTLSPAAPNGWHSVLASRGGTAREYALRGCESSLGARSLNGLENGLKESPPEAVSFAGGCVF